LNDWVTVRPCPPFRCFRLADDLLSQGGTLTFADNSTVAFGALANDGSATLINLGGSGGSVVTDSIFLYITSVSSATGQAGLAEFQVYGTPCVGCQPSNNLTSTTTTQTSAGVTTGTSSGQNIALTGTASASSSFDAQGPEKAIDGFVSSIHLPLLLFAHSSLIAATSTVTVRTALVLARRNGSVARLLLSAFLF
jgi:hypothetical protein